MKPPRGVRSGAWHGRAAPCRIEPVGSSCSVRVRPGRPSRARGAGACGCGRSVEGKAGVAARSEKGVHMRRGGLAAVLVAVGMNAGAVLGRGGWPDPPGGWDYVYEAAAGEAQYVPLSGTMVASGSAASRPTSGTAARPGGTTSAIRTATRPAGPSCSCARGSATAAGTRRCWRWKSRGTRRSRRAIPSTSRGVRPPTRRSIFCVRCGCRARRRTWPVSSRA